PDRRNTVHRRCDAGVVLTGKLICAIRRSWSWPYALPDRLVALIAIHRCRRGVDDRHRGPAPPRASRYIKYLQRTGQIDPMGLDPGMDAALDRSDRREMEAAIASCHRC